MKTINHFNIGIFGNGPDCEPDDIAESVEHDMRNDEAVLLEAADYVAERMESEQIAAILVAVLRWRVAPTNTARDMHALAALFDESRSVALAIDSRLDVMIADEIQREADANEEARGGAEIIRYEGGL